MPTAMQYEYEMDPESVQLLVLDLPLELQNHIFYFLSAPELCLTASLVCQAWHDLATQELMWKKLCKQDFACLSVFDVKKPRGVSWRLWFKFLGLIISLSLSLPSLAPICTRSLSRKLYLFSFRSACQWALHLCKLTRPPALDGLMFLKSFSAPRLRLTTKRQRGYTVRSCRKEHESTLPFPPPHKLARTQLSLQVRSPTFSPLVNNRPLSI